MADLHGRWKLKAESTWISTVGWAANKYTENRCVCVIQWQDGWYRRDVIVTKDFKNPSCGAFCIMPAKHYFSGTTGLRGGRQDFFLFSKLCIKTHYYNTNLPPPHPKPLFLSSSAITMMSQLYTWHTQEPLHQKIIHTISVIPCSADLFKNSTVRNLVIYQSMTLLLKREVWWGDPQEKKDWTFACIIYNWKGSCNTPTKTNKKLP